MASDSLRGEVWWVAFDSSVGGETRKTRPAVIVSNNAANTALNGERRKAMADQIATASKLRLRGRVGALSASDLAAVERAVRVQPGL
jgi:mRNA interferase MazF